MSVLCFISRKFVLIYIRDLLKEIPALGLMLDPAPYKSAATQNTKIEDPTKTPLPFSHCHN